jgi:hypothetical protein
VLVVTFPDESLQIGVPCGDARDGGAATCRPGNSLFKTARSSSMRIEANGHVPPEVGSTGYVQNEEEGHLHGADVVSATRAAQHSTDDAIEIELRMLPEQVSTAHAVEQASPRGDAPTEMLERDVASEQESSEPQVGDSAA